MSAWISMINNLFSQNGLIVAFFIIGTIMIVADGISKKITKNRIHVSAIATVIGFTLAYIGGFYTGGTRGLADIPIFTGLAVLGSSMFRDFAIVSTAFGSDLVEIRKIGRGGIIALALGVTISFTSGAVIAFIMGYRDAISIVTIGAGACSLVVGSVTGPALGASSQVLAISIAVGVVKSVVVMVCAPIAAKLLQINSPQSAMIFGGLMGTTSGASAGLEAVDSRLVPYGAMMATFFTAIGCLLCPSIFYIVVKFILGV